MNYLIKPFLAQGIVDAVPSKSYAHRAIILSALTKGKTTIKNIGNSVDVLVTLDCVSKLGAKVNLIDGGVEIYGIENPPKETFLDFKESGSSMRFFIPVALSLGVKTTFTGSGKLLTRPNDALYFTLSKKGAIIDGQTLSGKLESGVYEIDSTVSSQYVSGLLMALSILDGESEIRLIGQTVSKDYINITLEFLDKFGVKYQLKENSIFILGGRNNSVPKEIVVEGDWSSAAFPLALGALGDKVTIKGLNINSVQGDKKIIEILKGIGAKLDIKGDGITVCRGDVKGVKVDMCDIPDMAPALASILANAKGKSELINVDRLKIKESDRLSAIINNLRAVGVEVNYDNNTLYIDGGSVSGGTLLGYNDHRMVMSGCVLASVAQKNCIITDVHAVSKSYPQFFSDYIKLGGNYSVNL